MKQNAAVEPGRSEAIARQAVDLLQNGHADEALRACRDLVTSDDASLDALDTILWLALTAEDAALAATIAARVAALRPLDADRQRTAAALLVNLSRFEEALPFAVAASEMAPEDFEAVFLLGLARNQAGHTGDAVRSLLRAVNLRPDHAEAFHQLSVASTRMGRADAATELAIKAFHLDPTNASRAVLAAAHLRREGRIGDAIRILAGLEPQGEAGAHLSRLLSDCLLADGRPAEALAAIDRALALAPDHPEYLLFRADLLNRIGDYERAALGLDAALAADPDNLHARRHAVTLYLEGGRFERAVQSTAELLRRAPDHGEYASCMLHVLAMRSEAAVDLPDVAALKRQAGPRRARPAPSAWTRLRTQLRVTGALMLREMRTRFGESRLGYLWVLVEMGIHLGVLAIVFQLMMHGQPPMGQSFFFFYFTGLLPYLLFLHTSEHAGSAIVQNRHMLQLPMVNHFNAILSRGLLELFTQVVIAGLFIAGFLVAGVHAVPSSAGQAALALLVAWLFGMGFGFVNAVLNTLMHAWHHVFSVVIRLLYFCSGIFYVPAAMPIAVRDLLAWNPLLQCVDWFRTTFFDGYQPHWLDRTYAVEGSLAVILAGLTLEAVFRRRLRMPA